LLENAFKYAYETETSGGAMCLRVRYEVREARDFDIVVENSGTLTDDTLIAIRKRLTERDDEQETTALVNIHKRLQIYFGEISALIVERSALGGLLVRLHIENRREGE
jgi:two-component system sensor histidine kinase YesM